MTLGQDSQSERMPLAPASRRNKELVQEGWSLPGVVEWARFSADGVDGLPRGMPTAPLLGCMGQRRVAFTCATFQVFTRVVSLEPSRFTVLTSSCFLFSREETEARSLVTCPRKEAECCFCEFCLKASSLSARCVSFLPKGCFCCTRSFLPLSGT